MKFSEKELEKRIDLLHQYSGDMRFLKPGTPVCCNLFGFWEHSGIYLGNGKIAHLTGDGDIEAVYPEEFVARIGNESDEPMKYACSSKNQRALASYAAYCFAHSKIGKTQEYKLLKDNCHRFTARCLSINDDIDTCFFDEPENCLERIIEKEFGDFYWVDCSFAVEDYDDPDWEEEFAIGFLRSKSDDFPRSIGLRKSALAEKFRTELMAFLDNVNSDDRLSHPVKDSVYESLAKAEDTAMYIYYKYCHTHPFSKCSIFIDKFFEFCNFVRWLRVEEYSALKYAQKQSKSEKKK